MSQDLNRIDFDTLTDEQLLVVRESMVSLDRRRETHPREFFKLNPFQKRVCESKARRKFMVCSNKCGKTAGMIYDMIANYALKKKGIYWVVSYKMDNHGETTWRAMIGDGTGDIPPILAESEYIVKAWHNQGLGVPLKIELVPSGSIIYFWGWMAGRKSFEGPNIDGACIDDGCDQDVFNEIEARLFKKQGRIWFAKVPLDGKDWTWDELQAASRRDDSEHFAATMWDNQENLPEGSIERISESWSTWQKRGRLFGEYTQPEGRVFYPFDRELHVIDIPVEWFDKNLKFRKPPGWPMIRAMDAGADHPFVCLWFTVTPDGDVLLYDEHYAREKPLSYHAAVINRKSGNSRSTKTVMDASAKQVRIDLQQHKIAAEKATRDLEGSIQVVNDWLTPHHATSRPRFFILKGRAPHTIEEMDMLHYDDKGRPADVHDDTTDCVRYAFGVEPWRFRPKMLKQERFTYGTIAELLAYENHNHSMRSGEKGGDEHMGSVY